MDGLYPQFDLTLPVNKKMEHLSTFFLNRMNYMWNEAVIYRARVPARTTGDFDDNLGNKI